jgi:cytochrome c553
MQIGVLRETQRCGLCKQQVAIEEFSPSYQGRENKDCRPCRRAAETRRRRERGIQSKGLAWTPEFRRQNEKDWKAANPDRRLAANLKANYGDLITVEDYNKAIVKQNGLCATCHQPETRKTPSGGIARMAADHCHATGVFRGLLCCRCNFALGYAQEDPAILRALADYIEKMS